MKKKNELVNIVTYKSIIGSLIYLTKKCTCQDISFSKAATKCRTSYNFRLEKDNPYFKILK